jgi:hypothetical protein
LRKTNAPERDTSSGIALIELLIYSALLMVVMGATLSSLEGVTNAQSFQMNRSQTLASMRVTLNRMTAELRQASSVDPALSNPSTLTFSTYVRGAKRNVTYRAQDTVLSRAFDGGADVPVLQDLASTNVFTTVTANTAAGVQWVAVNLRVHASKGAGTELVLDSEVNLRNRTAGLAGSA